MWQFLEFKSAWLGVHEADLDESRARRLSAHSFPGRAAAVIGDVGRRLAEARWSAYNPLLPKAGI